LLPLGVTTLLTLLLLLLNVSCYVVIVVLLLNVDVTLILGCVDYVTLLALHTPLFVGSCCGAVVVIAVVGCCTLASRCCCCLRVVVGEHCGIYRCLYVTLLLVCIVTCLVGVCYDDGTLLRCVCSLRY